MRISEKIPRINPRFFGTPSAPLEEFFDWYAQNGNTMIQAPVDGITFIGNGPALVMHREPPFQVQLFVCTPNTVIPKHSHPHVESYEVNVSGDVEFLLEDQAAFPENLIGTEKKDGSGLPRFWGYRTYVGPNAKHKAIIGPRGGAFLSIQKWLRDPPTSVDEDWEGSPMSADHMEALSHALLRKMRRVNAEADFEPYISGQLCD